MLKDLETGKMLSDQIKGVNSYVTWSSDSKTFFYTGKDKETLRSDKIFKHNLGDNQSDDRLVYEEEDETFSTYVYPSKSRNIYLLDLKVHYLLNSDIYLVILQIMSLG